MRRSETAAEIGGLRTLGVPFIISLILVLVAFTPLPILAVLGCLVLWTLYWPWPRFFNSWLLRLVMAFALTVCFQQLTAAAFWLVKIHYTVQAVIILELLVYLALVYFGRRHVRSSSPRIINKADIAALVVSVGTTLVLLLCLLHGGSLLQQLLRQVTTGRDNIEHISLTQTIYNNGGYVYGPVNQLLHKVIYSNLASYPQGWSLSTAILWHSVTAHAHIQTHPTLVLFLYVSVFLLWFTLILFLFCRLLIAVIELLRRQSSSAVTYFGSVMFTLLAEVVVLIDVVYNGFASFLPSLLFPLALGYSIVALLKDPEDGRPNVFLVNGLLLAGGISFSWLLAAPAGYLMVILGLLAYFKGSVKAFIVWFFGNPWRIIGVLVLLGLASIQGFVQILYGVKDLVNMPGGINSVNSLVIFAFLFLAVAGAIYYKHTAAKNSFLAILSGSLLVSGGVYLYQFTTSGTATYFSTKADYASLMLILLLGSASLLALLEDFVVTKTGQVMGVVFVLAFAIFVPIATNLSLGTSPQLGIGSLNYWFGKRFLSGYSASQISALLAEHKLNHNVLILYKHLGFAEDIDTTDFANMVTRDPSSDCQNIVGVLSSQWALNKGDVLGCAANRPFYVIVSASDSKDVRAEFKGVSTARIILSN